VGENPDEGVLVLPDFKQASVIMAAKSIYDVTAVRPLAVLQQDSNRYGDPSPRLYQNRNGLPIEGNTELPDELEMISCMKASCYLVYVP
jgi:hypothetical protein